VSDLSDNINVSNLLKVVEEALKPYQNMGFLNTADWRQTIMIGEQTGLKIETDSATVDHILGIKSTMPEIQDIDYMAITRSVIGG